MQLAKKLFGISYLEGNNVIAFMKILFAHIYTSAHRRDQLKPGDLEYEDVSERFRQMISCSCDTCMLRIENRFGTYGNGVSVFNRRNRVFPLSVPHGQAHAGTAPEVEVLILVVDGDERDASHDQ